MQSLKAAQRSGFAVSRSREQATFKVTNEWEISSWSGTTTRKIRTDKSGVTTMCLARPVKVLKCDGMWVEVEDGGARHRAYSALLANKEVAVGDYLLVHGELAIHKLPTDEALKIIALIDTLDHH